MFDRHLCRRFAWLLCSASLFATAAHAGGRADELVRQLELGEVGTKRSRRKSGSSSGAMRARAAWRSCSGPV
jgi:hypothetical protein